MVRRAYGMANLETGTPWTPETISESGSTAKQFTASGLVLLARDGKLSLDDDITRWVPEAKGFGKKITIRHLLTHTSGIPDRYTLHEVEGRPAGETDHNNAEVMDIVSHLRELNFDPGEDYLYSNTNYVIAAAILERVSGMTLQQFTSTRIFTPLNMTSTRWREDHRTVVPGRASAYTGNLSRNVWQNDHPFTRVIGAGGLLTTVGDFLKWEAAFQQGGEPWGAVRDSLEHMGRLNDGTALTYGLGVGSDTWRGVHRVSHTGSTGGYRAVLQRYPDQKVAIAILCNGGSAVPGDLASRVASLVLGNVLAAEPTDPAPVAGDGIDLTRYAGAYRAPRTEEVLVLYVRNGQLMDSTTSNGVLIPVATGKFRYRGSERTLSEITGTGGGMHLKLESPNGRAVEYEMVSRPALTPALRNSYVGTYRSPELGGQVRIVADGDYLRIAQAPWEQATTLQPIYQDGFRAGGLGNLRFTRDARGRITGFVLWAGRVRHLRFDKVTP